MIALKTSGNTLDMIFDDLLRLRADNGTHIMPNEETEQSIILLGGSKVGKTTILGVLKDSLYCRSRSQYYILTTSPTYEKIGGLCVIDTPDIFDRQNRLSECRITKKGLIIKKQEIPFSNGVLPLFALVFSLENGINSSDITALLHFKKKFLCVSRKMMLILTHAEEKTESQRHMLLHESFDESRLANAKMRSFFERGVLFMGCIRYESMERCNRQALLSEHCEVLQMRAQLIERCQDNESTKVVLYSEMRYSFRKFHYLCCCFALVCIHSKKNRYSTKLIKDLPPGTREDPLEVPEKHECSTEPFRNL
ncbi:unnamed protein product [Rotaria magnacalcarata]|uniref:G domain-containing protein n=1 Tax=Rotaria magnacalcarata TaxID=392030 RepID=A0A816FV78_9BILA|nr:unnamed protein product [Rotaria magnacalcarata]